MPFSAAVGLSLGNTRLWPRADLGLQLGQVDFVGVELVDQPLVHQRIADARRRNGNDCDHGKIGAWNAYRRIRG